MKISCVYSTDLLLSTLQHWNESHKSPHKNQWAGPLPPKKLQRLSNIYVLAKELVSTESWLKFTRLPAAWWLYKLYMVLL